MAGRKATSRPGASPVDTMRVLAIGASVLLAAGIGGLIIAIFTGAGGLWGLAGFGLAVGGVLAWRARVQVGVVRQSSPAQALTGRELARYAGLGLGLVVLVAAVAGISSALA
jgi:hypothetical protein